MKIRKRDWFLWILIMASVILSPSRSFGTEKKLYVSQNLRDPFVQLLVSGPKQAVSGLLGVESLEDVRVEGIMKDADPSKSMAVLNGTMVRQGEESGSVKVLEIRPDGVQVSVNGVEGFKRLYQGNG
jgi:hypothetical protein